jgi:hypothetical protein
VVDSCAEPARLGVELGFKLDLGLDLIDFVFLSA